MNDAELIARLRNVDGWFFEDPCDHIVYVSDDPLEAADRLETLTAENERLREAKEDLTAANVRWKQYAKELEENIRSAWAALKQGEQ